MPERAELAACEQQLRALAQQVSATQAERDELARNEKRLEDEITMIREKAAQTDKTLYSGTVNVPRELTALQEELEALGRRQRQLEDQELELMEQAEPLDAALAEFDAARATLDGQAADLLARIAEAETAIDLELADVDAQRAAAVQPVPADLLDEYEKLRGAL